MSQSLDLKELEHLAFRRTYQDGLYDIYLGGMFISFAAFAFTVFPGSVPQSFTTLLYLVLGIGLSGLVFWLGKKYITLPRIGLVNFGPARRKRKKDLILALGAIVAVQVLVLLLQFSYLQSPAVQEWLAPVLGQADKSNLMIAFVAVIFVAPGVLLIAYKADIPRGYYHAVVMALAVFLMILLDQAWWMALGGVLILLPGLVLFVLFLQHYPLEKNLG
jgi:hypothetical protein